MSASAGEAIGLLLAAPYGYLFAAVWGALWGSFFNVAIHRLAREDASLAMVVRPPSHCPRCKAPIRAFDNVPLLGWLLVGARCRSCKAPISVRYPLVEAAGLGMGLLVYQRFVLGHPDDVPLMLCRFLVYFAFVGTLFVLAVIDWETTLLPEAITRPAIFFFFFAGRVFHDVSWLDALLGAVAGFGLFKLIELGYAAVRGRDGLGGGDAMLMAIVGGFLGWQALPTTLGLGATLGVVVALPPLLWQRRQEIQQRLAALPSRLAALPSSLWRGRGRAARAVGRALLSLLLLPLRLLYGLAILPLLVWREWQARRAEPDDDAPGTEEPAEAAADARDLASLGQVAVPFGPFLVAGALCHLFLSDLMHAWLLGLLDVP